MDPCAEAEDQNLHVDASEDQVVDMDWVHHDGVGEGGNRLDGEEAVVGSHIVEGVVENNHVDEEDSHAADNLVQAEVDRMDLVGRDIGIYLHYYHAV